MEAYERIRYLRKEVLCVSLEEFSKKVNIPCPYLREMEAGKAELTEQALSSVCRIFHVHSEWVVSGLQPIFAEACDPLDAEIEKLYFALTDENKKYLYDYIQRLLENQGF